MTPRAAVTKWPWSGLDDTAPRPACPVGRPSETRAFPFCLASREQPDDPFSSQAKIARLWGSVEPQLSAHTSSFSPCPYAHDDKLNRELLCCPRQHKAMNEQNGKEMVSDVPFEEARLALPRVQSSARSCPTQLGDWGQAGQGRDEDDGGLRPRGRCLLGGQIRLGTVGCVRAVDSRVGHFPAVAGKVWTGCFSLGLRGVICEMTK